MYLFEKSNTFQPLLNTQLRILADTGRPMASLSHLAPAEGLLGTLLRELAMLAILHAREAQILWTFSGHTPTF